MCWIEEFGTLTKKQKKAIRDKGKRLIEEAKIQEELFKFDSPGGYQKRSLGGENAKRNERKKSKKA
jgi:hypothetical protein